MSSLETIATQDHLPLAKAQSQTFARKVFVQTWGCQMNVADTERMLSLLSQRNYKPTQNAEDADLVLLNTCHIREKARHKVVSRLGELKPLKSTKPGTILAVAGCVAQAEAKILSKEVPFVDLIFGPDQIDELPNLLEGILEKQTQTQDAEFALKHSVPVVNTAFKNDGYTIPIDVVQPWMDDVRNEVSRYVNIIKGCNNFCTFCVVPFTRGREKSRPAEEVVAEAKFFSENDVKEITLLGQNVNSYGLDFLSQSQQPKDGKMLEGRLPFADLLYQVGNVDGIERIRFTTSNPHDFTLDLAQAFRDIPKLCDHFHLPVQSGSNKILEKMNRQYTREQYFERVEWIRAARPNLVFSTDIIVGFPGETEEDFEETMNLVEQMKYSFIYAFKYSPRRGTAAARMKDQVPEPVKDARLQRLLKLQRDETERQNNAEIGKTREVLVTYKNSKDVDSWYGRTFQGRLVKVSSPVDIVGKKVMVNITGANVTALEGHALS